jgi:hypothetical protein
MFSVGTSQSEVPFNNPAWINFHYHIRPTHPALVMARLLNLIGAP